MLTVGSLFTGIGGMDLGLEKSGMKIKWQVEINDYCNKVLVKHWPNVPKFGDIKDCGEKNLEPVELICGGVPCQPASVAGKRRGTQDDRWLWPDTFRIVRELRPRWCLFENVTGILSLESGMVFESLLSQMEAEGYEVQAFIIPACGVDAPHRRNRVWIVAYAPQSHDWINTSGTSKRQVQQSGISSIKADVANTSGTQHDSTWKRNSGERRPAIGFGECSRRPPQSRLGGTISNGISRWLVEPRIPRVATGVKNRVSRLKALGNSVVPQIVEIIGQAIIQIDNI